jgi:hypothetical protein
MGSLYDIVMGVSVILALLSLPVALWIASRGV